MAPKVRSLKMGAYNDPEAEMGPVVKDEAKARIEGYIDQGVESGAELVVDGRGVSLQGYENGFFVGGSLFDKVTTEMSIYKDEIFGPVLCVVRAETYEEAKKKLPCGSFFSTTGGEGGIRTHGTLRFNSLAGSSDRPLWQSSCFLYMLLL